MNPLHQMLTKVVGVTWTKEGKWFASEQKWNSLLSESLSRTLEAVQRVFKDYKIDKDCEITCGGRTDGSWSIAFDKDEFEKAAIKMFLSIKKEEKPELREGRYIGAVAFVLNRLCNETIYGKDLSKLQQFSKELMCEWKVDSETALNPQQKKIISLITGRVEYSILRYGDDYLIRSRSRYVQLVKGCEYEPIVMTKNEFKILTKVFSEDIEEAEKQELDNNINFDTFDRGLYEPIDTDDRDCDKINNGRMVRVVSLDSSENELRFVKFS